MPLNVRRFCTSLFLVVFGFLAILAQTPTSGDVMRSRISKAKALIATRNYPAAIYELENIRRETSDQTVHGVLNVLLMNCYLDQSDYKRAQTFLDDLFNGIKAKKPSAAASYYAAAGQVIKGARNQFDRYKSLGLSVSDRNLDPAAVADLEKMRETLEQVIEQSRTVAKDTKETANAFAVLEEASAARGTLARDDFDSKRWKDEVADSREMLANSQSTVFNAMVTDQPTVAPNTVAVNNPTTVPANTAATNNPTNVPTKTLPVPSDDTKPTETVLKPVVEPAKTEPVPAKTEPAKEVVAKKEEAVKTTPAETPGPRRVRRVTDDKKETQSEPVSGDGTIAVGSLLEYAVQKSSPVYPASARTLGQKGIVRVELLIDENGQVAAVQNLSGPMLLQGAAKDAVRKWKFRPFVRDGQPVKATGFLSFNFNL